MLEVLRELPKTVESLPKLQAQFSNGLGLLNSHDLIRARKAFMDCLDMSIVLREHGQNHANECCANAAFVLSQFMNFLICFCDYHVLLHQQEYERSWDRLQDIIDYLSSYKKFEPVLNSGLTLMWKQHLQELEKLYGYSIFCSSEIVAQEPRCSICNHSPLDNNCPHIAGNLYWGKVACVIWHKIERVDGISFVQNPRNKRCVPRLIGSDKEELLLLKQYVKGDLHPLEQFAVLIYDKTKSDPKFANILRNDMCPCGSGKKYKKCCDGKEHTIKYKHGHIELTRMRLVTNFTLF